MLLEQYINFFNWLYAFLRKFKTLNLLFSFSQLCKCPKIHWLELDLLQVCGSIGTGLRSSNVLVFQAEGASHHSNGSWWRGKENISISCLLLYISINMPIPLAYKCWQLWGNGLWYNGWNLDQPCFYCIICYPSSCKDDIMFLFSCWRNIKKRTTLELTETGTSYKRAFVLFAISKPLVLFYYTLWKLHVSRQGWRQGQK